MEDIYERIFSAYGLKLYSTQRTRRGLICKTDRGVKELRRTSSDGKTIVFENQVKKHLRGKGFSESDVYLETLEKEPYYTGIENNYVVSDFVATVDVDLNNLEMAQKAVGTMAKVHKLSQGFEGTGKTNLGKLPLTAKKRKSELVRTKKWINNQSGYSPLDVVVVKNHDYFMERTKRSENLLNSQSYKDTVDLAVNRKNICHNNFKGDSVRSIDGNEKMYITGFEKCAFDCGVSDLADFLRRQIKEDKCDAKKIDILINTYNEVLPLNDFELKAMGAMILFPAKFFKICNSFYNKRRVIVSATLIDKLERSIAISEKEERILKEIQLI